MDLAALLYNYERGVVENKKEILEKVVEDSMTPLYEQLCTKFNWELDQSVLETLKYVSIRVLLYTRVSSSCLFFFAERPTKPL